MANITSDAITKQGDKFVVASVVKDFEQQAGAALDQIATDRATLAGSPTNAQIIAVLDNALARQAKEVTVLRKLLRQK
ncbi:hypothetical protein ACFLYO_11000 [Chloroflexota bacterium]